MYEYVGKTTGKRINKNWKFFTKGKLYDQDMKELGVGRGIPEEDFVNKDAKPVAKKEEKAKPVAKKPVSKSKYKKK